MTRKRFAGFMKQTSPVIQRKPVPPKKNVVDDGGFWDSFTVLDGYSQAQAIDDGVLVDVTDWQITKESGFKCPVIIASGLWAEIEGATAACSCVSETGVLADIFNLFHFAVKRDGGKTDMLVYQVLFAKDESGGTKEVTIWAKIGSGDTAAPVITFMLPSDY